MTRWLLAATLAVALIAGPADAAQDDPRLDDLFARLAVTQDEAEAQVIESFIWTLWLEGHDDTLNDLMAQGARDMQVGDLDAAINRFGTLIELAPDFAEAWNKRATVYYMIGRYDEAIADCMQVLAREPRHFGALSGLGLIHQARGEDAEALAWYRRALEQNPHMPGIRQRVEVLSLEVEGEAI
jgi:tetratricopeptide (TPR) repeat protein